jgi:hypothetical protein
MVSPVRTAGMFPDTKWPPRLRQYCSAIFTSTSTSAATA